MFSARIAMSVMIGDAVAGDLDEPFADREEIILPPLRTMISPGTICVISGTCCG